MEEKKGLLNVVYILTVLSVALLVSAIVVLWVGAAKEPKQGERGYSAYEIALKHGFSGSEQEWLDSLVGKQGEQGAQGIGVSRVEQKTDKWGIKTWFSIVYTDGSSSDTQDTPIYLVDPDKSYQAETDEERDLLRSYGVRGERIFSKDGLTEQLGRGGTVEALTDLTLPAGAPLTRDCTVELNGNTLTVSGNASLSVAEGVSLTLSGGTVASDANDAIAAQRAVFLVGKGSALTLDGIVYRGNSPLIVPEENSEVSVLNATVETNGYYAVATNATYGENMTVRIENSKISALRESGDTADGDATAVLVNVPCTLTVKGSECKGSRQALVVRCGTAVVSDSALETTGGYPDREKYLHETWSQGNEAPMAGLVVGNRNYAAYRAPAAVSLQNTRIAAPQGVYTAYLYGNEEEAIGASLDYDGDSDVGTCFVGGGEVKINGEKQDPTSEPRFLPLLPDFLIPRRGF